MTRALDLEKWPRRHHFEFFKDYELPFFSLCAQVDVSRLHARSKEEGGPSYFLASLYLALQAANAIESFRYRLDKDAVVVHDVIHPASTVMRDDGTFGFAYYDHDPSYRRFEAAGLELLARARTATGPLEDQPERNDVIFCSVIPWVHFTGVMHAQRLRAGESTPKMVFGKHVERDGTRWMPVSMEVHHALLDGLDVGRFYQGFQQLLDDPEALGT